MGLRRYKLILVTGSSGFVAGSFIDKFSNSESILGVDLRKRENLSKEIICDLTLENSLEVLPKDGEISAILHSAAIISPKECELRPYLAMRTNLLGTLNMLEFARKNDVARFVYISSGGVYQNSKPSDDVTEEWPLNLNGIYSISKISSEDLVRYYSKQYSIDCISLRITAPYGPHMVPKQDIHIPDALNRHTLIFALKCINNENIFMPVGGDHTINYTYIEDITQGIYKSIHSKIKGYECFNITSGFNYTIRELGEAIKSLCPQIDVKIGPGNLLNSYDTKDPLNSKLHIQQGKFNISKAKKLLGYEPQYNLKRGMQDLIKYLKA